MASKLTKRPKTLPTATLAQFIKDKINNPAPYPPHGSSESAGLSGNLTVLSLTTVLEAIKKQFKPEQEIGFLDIGSGEGCAVVGALIAANFKYCFGIEICSQVARHSNWTIVTLLNRVSRERKCSFEGRWMIKAGDIEDIASLPSTVNCIYSFWTGMPTETIAHIIALALKCNIEVLAVSYVARGDTRTLIDHLRVGCAPEGEDLVKPMTVRYGKSSHQFCIFNLLRLSEKQRDDLAELCIDHGSFLNATEDLTFNFQI